MLDAEENIIHGLIFLMLGFLYDMTFYREVQTPRGELSASFQTKRKIFPRISAANPEKEETFPEIMTAMK